MVICECCTNWTDLNMAKRMIKAAKENGADPKEIGRKMKQVPMIQQLEINIPIGTVSKTQNGQLWMWSGCIICGKPRWVRMVKGRALECQCKQCANIITGNRRRHNKHPYWKGGKGLYRGYYHIFVTSEHPLFAMVNKTNMSKKGIVTSGYILEHRYLMAQSLGRLLADDEIVHHINGNKLDNNLSNLYLMKAEKHKTSYGTAFTEGYNLGYKQGYNDAVKNRMALS